VLGPKDPFSPEEVAALKRYTERGGSILLALDPEALTAVPTGDAPTSSAGLTVPTPSASNENAATPAPNSEITAVSAHVAQLNKGGVGPDLNALASLLGLAVEPTILANDSGNIVRFAGNKSDLSRIVSNRFSSHASVSTLSRHSAWVVLFGAGSLKKLDENDKGIDFALRSTTTTFADENGNFAFDSNEQRKSYDIAAAVSRKGEGANKTERRGFVVADADLFSDTVLMSATTNRFLLLDAIRWLGGDESLAGEVSSEEDVRIEHTKDKDVFWFYLTILGVPALVLGLGLYVSRKAKRKGESR
jgi:hypothetical protein